MNNNFGINLKKIREQNNLSIRALSMLTGISRQSISDWERGKKIPRSFATRKLLATVFKISPFSFDNETYLKENPVITDILKRLETLEKGTYK